MDEVVKIKAALAVRGQCLYSWAKNHGYLHPTVYVTVKRWGNRSERPHGGIARDIMEKLRRELG